MVLTFGSFAFCANQTNSVERLTVHGRLMYCNGNPSCRIWIVGTKRLLGMQESGEEVADMPKALGRVFKMLGVRRRGIWAGSEAELPLRPIHPLRSVAHTRVL
jgi:hypothetical protein